MPLTTFKELGEEGKRRLKKMMALIAELDAMPAVRGELAAA